MFSDANCTTAAATGSKIRCWKDKSGNLYNATQTANGAANNPTWQGTSITFAGKKPFFSISGGIFPANTTISALDIFIVMSATSAGGYALYYPTASVISAMIPNSSSQTVWQFGGTTFTSAWGGATGSIYLWNFMSSATATTKFWRSDTNLNNSSTAITTTSSGTANFYIGCDTTGLSNAINCSEPVINEILIYNSMLSDNDRVNIRKYLKAKWTTLAY
jgi:cytochrome c biogenesis factor